MATKVKALKDCAVVAGREVHTLKLGEEKKIALTPAELKFSVDRDDISLVSGKPTAKPIVPNIPKPKPFLVFKKGVPGPIASFQFENNAKKFINNSKEKHLLRIQRF